MKKMNPHTARLIFWGILVVAIILYLIGKGTGNDGWFVAGLLSMIGGIVLDIVFYRCPECGRYLGRRWVNFCPWCGEDVTYDH